MVEYRAHLTLIPVWKPPVVEKFPGNFPSTEEAELEEDIDAIETERVKQIKEDIRELIFTPDKRIFQVGRASSNPNKGLTAAKDNAFFMSPVMSRYHAEMEMLEKKRQIRIRDTDSMHGTYVNDKALWSQGWKSLHSGDAITFGTQVARDGEVFMPKDFTCRVQWEKIEQTTPESPQADRRISGYGVSSEDLIISDDDTESVDFDKTSVDYCYSDGDDYSEDSDDERSDYDKDDSDTMDVEGEFPLSNERAEGRNHVDLVEKGKEKAIEGTLKPTADQTQQPSVTSVSSCSSTSRSKFSIGSLMNDTHDANGPKAHAEDGDSEMGDSVDSGPPKGKKEDLPMETAPGNIVKETGQSNLEAVNESVTDGLKEAFNSRPPPSPVPEESPESEGSDSDESPEELDAKGRFWRPTSSSMASSTAAKTVQSTALTTLKAPHQEATPTSLPIEWSENLKPTTNDASLPSCSHLSAGSIISEAKFSHLVEVAKRLSVEKKKSAAYTTLMSCPRTPRATSMTDKTTFFTAMKENQAKMMEKFREVANDPIHQNVSPSGTLDRSPTSVNNPAPAPTDSQTVPLPWTRGFAPYPLPALPHPETPTPIESHSSSINNTKRPTFPPLPHKNHIFEQILSSAEAKARVAKLETLKAAVYHHRNKRDVTFNPWLMDGGEFPLLGEEEADVASKAPAIVGAQSCASPTKMDEVRPRGFSISNLVHEQPEQPLATKPVPVDCKWIAEKVSKQPLNEVKGHQEDTIMDDAAYTGDLIINKPTVEHTDMAYLSTPRSTKRKHEDISEDDKIVQEPAIVEEKIQLTESSGNPVVVEDDAEMREVSEEKEIYEETLAAPLVENMTTADGEAPTQVETQQPPVKRARIFTTGFALGAVTGAVGVFAALVASAP